MGSVVAAPGLCSTGSMVVAHGFSKESACNAGDLSSIPGLGKSPGGVMATYSSILAWRIPWTEEPGVGYSPWGHKEPDMTERLSTTLMSLVAPWHVGSS